MPADQVTPRRSREPFCHTLQVLWIIEIEVDTDPGGDRHHRIASSLEVAAVHMRELGVTEHVRQQGRSSPAHS